jgi:hypothetical protein
MYCKRGNKAQELKQMVYRTDLNNWNNGNYSDLDRAALIRLVRYFENCCDGIEEEIIENVRED